MASSIGSNRRRYGRSLITRFYTSAMVLMLIMALVSTFVKFSLLTQPDPVEKKHALVHFRLPSTFLTNTSSLEKKNNDAQKLIQETDHENVSSTKEEVAMQREEDWGSSDAVFRQILLRSSSSMESCNSSKKVNVGDLKRITNATLLPEFGLIGAINNWLSNTDDKTRQCHLPPSTSCNVTGWSVVMMSYAGSDNKGTLINGIRNLSSRPETKEIILVWNSPRETLAIKDILGWNDDAKHPLRVFYALENGLENNLFNRYHPSIEPKMEALLYFDDDGPFFKPNPVRAGFELWKRNSGVQVGCFARNIRFKNPDQRMQKIMEEEIEVSERQVLNGWQAVSPYDKVGTAKALEKIRNKDEAVNRHPRFIPSCRPSGDLFEYNFNEFAMYRAHMTLPSGAFMHRNFLCFMWHPVFEEVRKFVLEHPTHPDDMTASMIVSQVSGKALRTYTRRNKPPKEEVENQQRRLLRPATEGIEVMKSQKNGVLADARFEIVAKKSEEDDSKQRSQIASDTDETFDVKKKDEASKDRKVNGVTDILEKNVQKSERLKRIITNKVIKVNEEETDTRKEEKDEESLHLTEPISSNLEPPYMVKELQHLGTSSERQRRRRLLWQHQDWGKMRTEAINSIIDYFGSISPGSVGYCFGTSHYIPEKKICDNNDATFYEDIPWMWEGQLGHNQC